MSGEKHPYEGLDERAFWKPSVAARSYFELEDVWQPKFEITKETSIATYGSCFAQDIGKFLQQRGYNWNVTEKPPAHASDSLAERFGYGHFSARTGNIYTTSMLKQWIEYCAEVTTPSDEVWEKAGRAFDPMRPTLEPSGFSDAQDMLKSRKQTLKCLKNSIKNSDVFVFTLAGLESWWGKESGQEYALCPGTVVGDFDSTKHRFVKQSYPAVLENLEQTIQLLRGLNPEIKILLSVSPIPMIATLSGQHVLSASTEGKSILRAVAGALRDKYDYVDYFPSYEIITSPAARGMFYQPNLREVTTVGLAFVMQQFFDAVENTDVPLVEADIAEVVEAPRAPVKAIRPVTAVQLDIEGCDEALIASTS